MTTILFSISAICEKLAGLIRARQLHDQNYFDVAVEPIFNHMLLVHENYISCFGTIVSELIDADIPASAIRDRMQMNKQALAHIRLLVGNLNKTLLGSWYARPPKTYKDAGLRESAFTFAYAVYKYFQRTTGDPQPALQACTWFSGFIGTLDHLVQGYISREEALEEAERALVDLPIKWKTVETHYLTLRTLCYSRTMGSRVPSTRCRVP